MGNALIGYTGFVGGCLAAGAEWSELYNSRNIGEIRGKSFRRVVCAGIQAKKWWANKEPEADWKGIESLLDALASVRAEEFVMISTIDVYLTPNGVYEDSAIQTEGLHAYGMHRWKAEEAVRTLFPGALVLRLPGLFGPGLRKNLIFDMHNGRSLPEMDASTTYQYYNTERLGQDIEAALRAGLSLANLATEPLNTGCLIEEVFPGYPVNRKNSTVSYDMRTRHAEIFGGKGDYIQSTAEVLGEIRKFTASEPRTPGLD